MAEKSGDCKCRIDRVETTSDTLTGRGGLAPFVQYLLSRKIVDLCAAGFFGFRRNSKGITVHEMIKQILCFFMDGTNLSISHFDELRSDKGYAAAIQTSQGDMASSHQVKRFFAKMGVFVFPIFRRKLRQFFRWRLETEKPECILLNVDPMLMNNDGAKKRQGVQPTYKRFKGFLPFQVSWGPYIVDAIFRGGSKSGNHGSTVITVLKKHVKLIRECLGEQIPIVVLMDAGFMDQKIFSALEDAGVGYVVTGKLYGDIVERADGLPEEEWSLYVNKKVHWDITSFIDQRESWDTARRLLFLRRKQEESGQTLLACMRPDTVFYTNIGMGARIDTYLQDAGLGKWKECRKLASIAHGRGSDELTWRAAKEFGSEKLPFKNFYPNAAYFYFMVISFNFYESYKRDVGEDIIEAGMYANTFRRRFIDVAAKVVRTGGQVILKVTESTWERLKFITLWNRACSSPAIILTG